MTREIDLSAGTIEYEDIGGEGPAIVLLPGLLMDASLWDEVVGGLAPDHRCIVPTLPMGAHRHPMHDDADLSPRGLARLVAELLDRLDLTDVTLVGNDTGGALEDRCTRRRGRRCRPGPRAGATRRSTWQPEGARLILGLAHAQGHLDLLEDADRVIPENDGAVVSYRLRGSGVRVTEKTAALVTLVATPGRSPNVVAVERVSLAQAGRDGSGQAGRPCLAAPARALPPGGRRSCPHPRLARARRPRSRKPLVGELVKCIQRGPKMRPTPARSHTWSVAASGRFVTPTNPSPSSASAARRSVWSSAWNDPEMIATPSAATRAR